MINKFKVLIVGCGNIASNFDSNIKLKKYPMSHAGAFLSHGGFNIEACVDCSPIAVEIFSKKWGTKKNYINIADIKSNCIRFDVVSICTPTETHYRDLLQAIKLKPKIIFCEKPLTGKLQLSKKIIKSCKNEEIALCVNYSRRWDPSFIALKEIIHSNSMGKLRSINAIYSKGILNNGSHIIDFLLYLLGPLTIEAVGAPIYDYLANDPTVPVWLKTSEGVPINISCGTYKDFAIFEAQFIFEQGILKMLDGGLRWQIRSNTDGVDFYGNPTLGKEKHINGQYKKAMLNAVSGIYNYLEFGTDLLSTGTTAIQSEEIVKKVMEKIKRP